MKALRKTGAWGLEEPDSLILMKTLVYILLCFNACERKEKDSEASSCVSVFLLFLHLPRIFFFFNVSPREKKIHRRTIPFSSLITYLQLKSVSDYHKIVI